MVRARWVERGQGEHEQESSCDDGQEPGRERGGGSGCEAAWESRSGKGGRRENRAGPGNRDTRMKRPGP